MDNCCCCGFIEKLFQNKPKRDGGDDYSADGDDDGSRWEEQHLNK